MAQGRQRLSHAAALEDPSFGAPDDLLIPGLCIFRRRIQGPERAGTARAQEMGGGM